MIPAISGQCVAQKGKVCNMQYCTIPCPHHAYGKLSVIVILPVICILTLLLLTSSLDSNRFDCLKIPFHPHIYIGIHIFFYSTSIELEWCNDQSLAYLYLTAQWR